MTIESLSNRRQLWLAAIKLPIYSVAIMPIWIGSMMAYDELDMWQLPIFAVFLSSAICFLIWTNTSNDVFDAATGIDKNKVHSVVNLTGNVQIVFWISHLFLGLGLIGISWISWFQGDLTVLILVGLSCLLGYLYQGPPFRLGYLGLGEILCFFAFGPLGVSAAYYSQTQLWSWIEVAGASVVGIVTSLILFCSHFNQVEDDLAAGKLSPVARLGTKRSAQLVPWIFGFIYSLTVACVGLNLFPLWSLLCFLALPFAHQLVQLLHHHHDHPDQVKPCRFVAVYFHFVYSGCLGLSFLLDQVL